ncbi:MAG: hypothetical protein KAI38_04185 [Candidatus Latescibacteria bacterium]|nr:hypothetical protein [Candidatus Latescibacterota bacterium]
MGVTHRWRREAGSRLQGSRPLDRSKLQAPCIVRNPSGGFRLFYTAVGPAKPYSTCQGYILSAVSDDGLTFRKERGIRLAPRPALPHIGLRVIAPTVTECADGRWRMYFEARGAADQPTVICSAVSSDMLHWEHEDGIRLKALEGVGGPRYLSLPDGHGRLHCFASEFGPGGPGSGERLSQAVVSAVTSDGLHFELEPGYRMPDKQAAYDTVGITAAEVIEPTIPGEKWTMIFSAWQDVPPGTVVPVHPSTDANAEANGLSYDFAAASIASDTAGYRSRIFVAHSTDGLEWERGGCAIDGAGYGGEGLDAVHAEDMSLIKIDKDKYRMYYAACDKHGNWRIASAVTADTAASDL